MTAPDHNPDPDGCSAPTAGVVAQVRRLRHITARSFCEVDSLLNGLERHIEGGVKGVFEGVINAPSTPVNIRAEHRRAHRAGVPAKLDADPELRAFVQARLATMTFDQIVRAVADSFPPPLRTSRSVLHRWWHRCGKHDTTA
jgi:hypothetical protein